MKWLLIFALYTGGHMDTMQQVKFSTKEMCDSGASQIGKTFAKKSEMFEWTCVPNSKQKEKKAKK